MRRAATILGCLSILALLSGSAMADSTVATKEAIFDRAFLDEYAAHLESIYGDVAADLWNEEELKGYEAFLYEIIGPSAKSYVKENLDTYKPLPVFRFEDTLPPVVDVYDLTPYIEDGDLAAVFGKGFDPFFPEAFLSGGSGSEEEKAGDPVIESVAAGICQIDPHSCIVCGHSESTTVRISIGTNSSEGLLKVCSSWDSGQTWYLTGYASLVDDYSVPYNCFQFNGGPASEKIQFVQEAVNLSNPNNYCNFDNYSSQFTGQNTVIGNGGYDEISGSQYKDQLTGEYLEGWDGNDTLSIQYTTNGSNARVVLGMKGDDTLTGTDSADQMWGGYGDDVIKGYGGNDMLYGHENAFAVWSYYGGDYDMYYDVIETKGKDRIWGGTGNDKICGGGGSVINGKVDYLYGEAGIDTIRGDFCECQDNFHRWGEGCGYGNQDNIWGGADPDAIFGGPHSSWILGGSGDDVIYGSATPTLDTIIGEDGYDWCWGGNPPPQLMPDFTILDDTVNCDYSCPDCGNYNSCDPC
jgi:hypothetical protein